MSTPEIPKDIIIAYGSARKFRKAMRFRASNAFKIVRVLDALRAFLPASQDIHDARILLDRIRLDLSQKRWGK